MAAEIEQKLVALANWAKSAPYLGILVRAANKSLSQNEKDMAASVAYFTFLSMFPLILGLISLGGYVLKSEDMQLRVNEFIVGALPVSADFVTQMIDSLIRIRGAVGVTSALVLIWSASKMVGALSRSINRALALKRNYAIYLSPLRNFGLTLAVATVIVLSLAVAPLLDLLSGLQPEYFGDRGNTFLESLAGPTSNLLATALMISVVYFLLPHRRLSFSTILPGLVTAAILIEIGKTAFVWYVETASSYSTVYGSVSTIIVLLLWLYFAARVVLYGAQVISINAEGK